MRQVQLSNATANGSWIIDMVSSVLLVDAKVLEFPSQHSSKGTAARHGEGRWHVCRVSRAPRCR